MFFLRPGKTGAEYCEQFVCVHEHIFGTVGPIFMRFCVHIPCGRGSVLIWQSCGALHTFGFMDDVMLVAFV